MSVSKQTGKKVVILSQRIRTEKYLGLYGLLFLVGCAGGGVGPTSPSPSPRTLTYASASAFETAEYNAQSGLALVKASSMY